MNNEVFRGVGILYTYIGTYYLPIEKYYNGSLSIKL